MLNLEKQLNSILIRIVSYDRLYANFDNSLTSFELLNGIIQKYIAHYFTMALWRTETGNQTACRLTSYSRNKFNTFGQFVCTNSKCNKLFIHNWYFLKSSFKLYVIYGTPLDKCCNKLFDPKLQAVIKIKSNHIYWISKTIIARVLPYEWM